MEPSGAMRKSLTSPQPRIQSESEECLEMEKDRSVKRQGSPSSQSCQVLQILSAALMRSDSWEPGRRGGQKLLKGVDPVW